MRDTKESLVGLGIILKKKISKRIFLKE